MLLSARWMWLRLTEVIVTESTTPLAFVCARDATSFLELVSKGVIAYRSAHNG